MYGMSIQMQDGAVRDALQRLNKGINQPVFGPIIGRAGSDHDKHHLIDYNNAHPNRLGGKRTNFFTKAGRSVLFAVSSNSVDLIIPERTSVPHRGIAQHYFGGVIKPVNGKLLTIPAIPETHGRRAREFDNLELIGSRRHGFLALVERQSTDLKFGRKRKDGTRSVKATGQRGGRVMFWLVPQVTQRPNPDVLPTSEALGHAVRGPVLDHLHQQIRREASRGNQ
jgi:hypothetical protein